MARPQRIEYEGAFHHVMSRGNDGVPIFRDDTDRLQFLALLAYVIVRFNWVLHDWVLMTNHFHLAIEAGECTLSRGMHWLLGAYAQWFNRRHGRTGHLYDRRFKNLLVENEEYLLTVTRYIALNPVKAGIVARPEDYVWSSYRARAAYEAAPSWLTMGAVQAMFGADPQEGREAYRTFVDEGMSEPRDLAEIFINKLFLGSAEWMETMQTLVDGTERSEEAPRSQVHPGRPAIQDLSLIHI